MAYVRHVDDPGNCNLRAMILSPARTGFDANLLSAMRRRAGIWVQVTPTISELDDLIDALEGADENVLYWMVTT
jgi:hypothetical protein